MLDQSSRLCINFEFLTLFLKNDSLGECMNKWINLDLTMQFFCKGMLFNTCMRCMKINILFNKLYS